MLIVVLLLGRNADYCYADCHYDKCCYAECCYALCRGAAYTCQAVALPQVLNFTNSRLVNHNCIKLFLANCQQLRLKYVRGNLNCLASNL